MTFSMLTNAFDQPTNALYQARDARLKNGGKILDLISGNVNAHGIEFPATVLAHLLKPALKKARCYRPDPLGQGAARRAISRHYGREGVLISEAQLVITPGTSISYWYCFKLLADVGDEILCPSPTYPLFESIASLCGIALVSYPLIEGDRWAIDVGKLEERITSKTKAIVLISPHNPTGAVANSSELNALSELASRHGLTLIHDEVFSPFLFAYQVLPRPAGNQAPLILTLNGFSKMFALPGMKIGWIGVRGDPTRVRKALAGLAMISDTFLPTNEWAQAAVPGIFKEGRSFLRRYQKEIRLRSALAGELIANCPGLSEIHPEGGFFMTVRLGKASIDEERLAVFLMRQAGIHVHPGFFYDMPGRHFVMTIVATPAELRKGITTIGKTVSSLL